LDLRGRNVHKILVGKPKGTSPLNIKMDLIETACGQDSSG